LAKLVQPSYSN